MDALASVKLDNKSLLTKKALILLGLKLNFLKIVHLHAFHRPQINSICLCLHLFAHLSDQTWISETFSELFKCLFVKNY